MDKHSIKNYNPIQSIVIYRNAAKEYYAESHAIKQTNDNKFVWCEGKALTNKALKAIALKFSSIKFNEIKIDTIFPENVLYFNQSFAQTKIIWWQKAQKRYLKFDPSLNIESRFYSMPSTLFCVTNDTLQIFALKDISRPTSETVLYKYPAMNQSNDGSVCMGNTSLTDKADTLTNEIKRWEKRYFNSMFTHFIDEEVIKPEYNFQLMMAENNEFQPFNYDCLIESDIESITDLI